MSDNMSNDLPLPPHDVIENLGGRLAQASIDAASWQVAQQETQRRAAEQIASLTEALQQRDQKVFAATRLIEELLAGAEQNPEGVASVTKQFLVQFCHGHGFPVQLPDSSPLSPAEEYVNAGAVATVKTPDAGLDA